MNFIILITLIAILLMLYIWYAGIISKHNRAKESLSGIDVQLKKRNDLIPNILKIASRFMEHEKDLIEKVTALRTQINNDYDANNIDSIKSHFKDVGALDSNLGKLMISVENYPNLKSDETMLQAMRTYNEVEEQISAARRFYNSCVTALNNSIQIFPGNILVNFSQAKIMPFYETDESSKSVIDADKFLR